MVLKHPAAGVALVVSLVGCSEPFPTPTLAQRARAECGARGASDYYFPADILDLPLPIQRRYIKWPTPLLRDIGAPSLSCGDTQPDEAYRFTWIHSFSSLPPVVATAARRGATWEVTAVQVRSDDVHAVTARRARTLSPSEGRALLEMIDRSQFWAMPIVAYTEEFGTDGGTAFMEGRLGAGYHVVRRWGSGRSPLYDLCLGLVRLSGIELPRGL